MEPTGGLNYGSIEGIRKGVEELSRYEMGVIPSRGTIIRCAKQLEVHAAFDHGLEIIEEKTTHGPVFSFEIFNFIRTVLRGFGLIEHAKTGSTSSPVVICWTLDYAQLTRELGHLTGGLKIVDPRAVDPVSGNLLLLTGKFQSRDLSFPCRLAFAKESKEVYKQCFGSFFEVFNAKRLVVPATATDPELSNFEVSSCQDLSSGWKTTTLGGGCKSTEYFCPQCMVSRKTVAEFEVADKRCDMCIRLGIDRCYCREVIDDDVLESTRSTLTSYIEHALDDGYERFDRIAKKSKLQFDQSIAGKEENKLHIDFEPKSGRERNAFIKLVNEEITIRLIEPEHSTRLHMMLKLPINQKKSALKEFAIFEKEIRLARLTINRHEVARDIAIALAVERLIPCILHMKMRLVEKVFHSLVNSALDRYGDSQADRVKRKLLADMIEDCMKEQVMGNESKGIKSQWKFRWTKVNNMEKPSLTGSSSQKILKHLKDLAAIAFSQELDEDSLNEEETRKQNSLLLSKWKKLGNNLLPLWKLIEQHDDYSDNEVDDIHIRCNLFMTDWLDLLGAEHMTNYIHIIGSGHLTYFASKYRNLYRFSQQGWESLNQMLKHYYFNNTNHGGSAGNGGKSGSGLYINGTISGDHCRPLMRLCQRSMMWKLGFGDTYFENIRPKGSTITEADVQDSQEISVQVSDSDSEHNLGFPRMTYGVL
jgi:hypothetical protein